MPKPVVTRSLLHSGYRYTPSCVPVGPLSASIVPPRVTKMRWTSGTSTGAAAAAAAAAAAQGDSAPAPKPAPSLEESTDNNAMIREARWASWAGLVPFIAGAASALYLPELGHWGLQWSHYLMWVQMSYGACVLSFLGAVHWGLALAPNAEARRARILWSVLPSLWATAVQAVPPLYGAPLLMIGFIAALAADSHAQRAGLLPAWYVRLRIPVTVGVVLSLGTSFVKLL